MKYAWPLTIALYAFSFSSFAGMHDNATASQPLVGTVAETMNGGDYTYMLVTEETSSQWVAARHMNVAVGDAVTVQPDMTMKNFSSPTLNRTFEHIIFAKDVQKGANADLPKQGTCPVVKSETTAASGITGEIVETMDTENYTYIQVRAPDKTVWAATSRFDAKIGDRVKIPDGMIMRNFESPTLKRKFDEIYFVEKIYREESTVGTHDTSPH